MARRPALVLTTAAALALAVAVPASASGPAGAERGRAAVERSVTYRATAPYHIHANGVKAGYVPDKYCVANRTGPGALGYPHFNHAYDNSVDPAKPAALYYEDDGRGGKRLVGVQWLVYDRDQNPATDDDRPTMFGRAFKGPQRGNFPGQPVHYALHLWLWKANPKGVYETYNQAVACLPGTTRPQPAA
ncbi:hypothetical protein [Streptomyces antarcticus]|uniref:hypothetical protein n=1 Tax=Streptomyces antarcticus TaxID=2996458 RepID=UPI00226F8DC1|nr:MULTISPECIES: hypothetical protein [unclassified Streptomyces]MCY0941516.1 hypothetical protein [Streptomyces sp. H34-AA3]MCZ4087655.1 hypothetical protein [Streptomyces sp. H34-S5]